MDKFTHLEKIKFNDGVDTTFLIDETCSDWQVDLQSDLLFNKFSDDELQRGERIPVHSLQEVLKFMDDHDYSYHEHLNGDVLKIGGKRDMNVYQDLNYEWEETAAELKPCPFCGKIPTIRGVRNEWLECTLFGEDNRHTEESWWISCETDHCPAYHMIEYDTRQKAIETWNRRVND